MATPSQPFQYLLNVLAEKTGLDYLEVNEEGACAVQFDEKVTVLLVDVPAEGALRLVSDLGPVSEGLDVAILHRTLLEANWLGSGTHGATLSIEPGTHHVGLWRQVSLEGLSPVTFMDQLGKFVDVAEVWTALIRGEEIPESEESSISPSLSHSFGIPA